MIFDIFVRIAIRLLHYCKSGICTASAQRNSRRALIHFQQVQQEGDADQLLPTGRNRSALETGQSPPAGSGLRTRGAAGQRTPGGAGDPEGTDGGGDGARCPPRSPGEGENEGEASIKPKLCKCKQSRATCKQRKSADPLCLTEAMGKLVSFPLFF